jgi:hypothetical protein
LVSNQEIKEYVEKKYGYTPKNAWIAHAKEHHGISVKRAHNRKSTKRLWPCPKRRLADYKEIFEHFKMI